MKILPRALEKAILRASKTFPAVIVTGPRQSGKTTLLRNLFKRTHRFVSLENPDVRLSAESDPLGFLAAYGQRVILDEIQYVPKLLSYIKSLIDENRKPGRWILTGSQNFVLMEKTSQSLAGRAAILSLLPFSYSEKIGSGRSAKRPGDLLQTKWSSLNVKSSNIAEAILRGCYPELSLNKSVDRQLWCGSYISTYLERDIRNLSNVGDLREFEKFLKLCAVRTGQILNLSELARDVGISVPTASRWISLLETGFQIYLLQPYHRNIGKRLVKSPKMYFTDTALASYLLGLHDADTLMGSPHFGSLFETMVVMDFLKRFYHSGLMPTLYYIRSRDGLEVDLVMEIGEKLHLMEIKSSKTITPSHATSIKRLIRELGKNAGNAYVISGGRDVMTLGDGVLSVPWHQILAR